MFGQPPISNSFSIGKVIGGLSKTLNVVNQVIPLYKEAKPMIQNARNAFSLIKEFTNTTTNKIVNTTNKNMEPIKQKVEILKQSNLEENKKGPTFFL